MKWNEVKSCISRVLSVNNVPVEVTDETELKTDSLGVTELCVSVEDAYGVEFSFDDMKKIQTVAALKVDLIRRGVDLDS